MRAQADPRLDLLRVVQVDGQFDGGADGFDVLHRFLDGRWWWHYPIAMSLAHIINIKPIITTNQMETRS